jgi:hypothetical protein
MSILEINPYFITYESPIRQIGDDTLQMKIIFQVDQSGVSNTLQMMNYGISVADWGENLVKYNLEDLVCYPGMLTVKLNDKNKVLHNCFYGVDSQSLSTNKQPEVEIYVNGDLDYSGDVQEDGVSSKNHIISLSCDPGTKILNDTQLYATTGIGKVGNGSGAGAIRTASASGGIVTVQIDDTSTLYAGDRVNIYNADGININGNFTVQSVPNGTHFTILSTQTGTYNTNHGTVIKLEAYNPLNYNDGVTPTLLTSYDNVTNLLEKIFKLVNPEISIADGDIYIFLDWLFYADKNSPETALHPSAPASLSGITFDQIYQRIKPLFFDSSKGLSNIGDVLKALAINWCCFTGMIHKRKAFFKKLFYYNPDNLQTLKILSREYKNEFSLIDCVRITTKVSRPLNYQKGVDSNKTFIPFEKILLVGCYDHQPTPDVRATDIFAFLPSSTWGYSDGQWVWYNVHAIKDPNLLSAAFVDSGELVSEFWYQNRCNPNKCSTGNFTTEGLTADFTKDFNDEGHKYQPIELTKHYGKGYCEIKASYLGEL